VASMVMPVVVPETVRTGMGRRGAPRTAALGTSPCAGSVGAAPFFNLSTHKNYGDTGV
jgi:hypothetical protein